MPSRRRLLVGAAGIAGAVGTTVTAAALAGTEPILADNGEDADRADRADHTDRIEWPLARYDPAGTAHNPDASGPKSTPELAWRQDTASTMHGLTAPILVGDTLYGVGRDSLVAFDRDTGEIQFERSGSYWSTPARAEATAYRSDTLAVYSRTGVYGLSADGGYELLGRPIGTERWHAPGQDTSNWSSSSAREPSPVAADGTVYAVIPETDRVAALDASSGQQQWEHVIGKERSIGTNQPVVSDGTVYVSSTPGDLVAFDAETGTTRWQAHPAPREESNLQYREFQAPTVTDAGIVVPDRKGVALFDRADGSLVWDYFHDGNGTDGSAAVADGTVFVTDGTESLHAIGLETGEREWTAEYSPDTHPIVADGVVYLGYQMSELVAIDADTGDRRWTYEDAIYFSQPIAADGVLYVFGDEGLMALEEGS
ncbi:PQQ repeat protein [Natrialba magadii ATCC 43099]|uniref:PQQ repeat protein n=1 Tax=Natrialba magadii (strain ATCC 43099 / DSM 3394 / CCM 3739 / CIP 104546 / IAM 13178 / JCM 8861 / NBRC 102185 / NCIMB 2190 / MS3) TaxID=547559 RepID=D3SSC4_NATMM|nr:PQQ-binding-like beta-propeller repeat protein [Natrialba magadii]ADD04850.1 PQQ repeat protein [Natrialba magadii ATCC 43099]ELY24435.1 pyrrolo-quinoline quinone [Natrialba magadii ATCC 43099]